MGPAPTEKDYLRMPGNEQLWERGFAIPQMVEVLPLMVGHLAIVNAATVWDQV
ncbi:hypothetical protein DSCW_50540 [Desulfosarcina widdelii]|uniref:Uncharacterized protein n=1 Tax=Desulfosarcina widdelii TaxID=947919 RepID=A0A5K7ZN90_9BACT|nr:hypothetical protein DSCW_50540 [Desulfosarcina widdelii]